METSTLMARAKRAAGWPLRRALDPRLEGLRNELRHGQELSASATQESMEALAVGVRMLRGSLAELADELHGRAPGADAVDELALLRTAALGAIASCGARAALAIGDETAPALAALGIAVADPEAGGPVDLVVAVSHDLAEPVPVERLGPGGTLVLGAGSATPAARLDELTSGLSVAGAVALAPAGAAGVDVEPHDPERADVARLVVARRP
jgi:hypothetical protein